MDAKVILENLLETSQTATAKGLEIAEQKLGLPEEGEQRDAMLDGLGKGALAAGAVAILLGTKSGRQLTGAFNQWQEQQNASITHTGTPINELEDTQAQTRSEAIVKAMISAAKSDGHVDTAEQKLIASKIESLGLEQDITAFLMKELNTPVDVAKVVASSDSPEAAREIYLASAMVADLNNADEREYMDSLAAGLELDAVLVKELEATLS